MKLRELYCYNCREYYDENELIHTLAWRDLTLRDLWELFKYFLITLFAQLLIYGIPLIIFLGVDFGIENSFGESGLKTYHYWLGILLLLLFLKIFWEDRKYIFNNFANLCKELENCSKKKFVIAIIFFLFASWVFKTNSYLGFSLLCVGIGIGFTIDQYIILLEERSYLIKLASANKNS